MARAAADVVIIGGGLIGTSAAFFLARAGHSVVLLERGRIGAQASGVNFGNCRRQGRLLTQLPLANRARELWGRMPDMLGGDGEFLPVGHLRVCYTQDDIGVIEDYARQAREYGLDLELLDRQSLRRRFPLVGPEALAGSFSPLDGHANPRLVTPLFGRAARQAGACIEEQAKVTGLTKNTEDFIVEVADGRLFRAPVVLVAAGAWGGGFSALFDGAVPMRSKGPQMAVTEPMPYRILPVMGVSTHVPGEVIYMRQIPRGNIIFGGCVHGPADLETGRAAYLPSSMKMQCRQLNRLAPYCAQARVIRTWSGVEGYVDDGRPVMGASPTVAGLHYAFGFCGHGFQIGPAVGEAMAELMTKQKTNVAIDGFSIDRFTGGGKGGRS